MKFSLIIPNWNGLDLLKKNLKKVLAVGADEIIVSDDDSKDGSLEYLKEKHPKLKVISHRRLGFAGNVNRGVEAAKHEIIILLNLDVIPQKNLLKPLKEDFQDPILFAVSFDEVNNPKFSWTKGYFLKGYIVHASGRKTKTPHQTFWVSGGSGAFRKSMWERLRGFDESFKFYWEDIDLCYRAQKRGWKCLWDPKAKVVHEHESTFKKLRKSYVSLIQERNQLLFIWKNLTDTKLMPKHIAGIFYRLRNPGYLKVFLAALLKLPAIIPKRLKEQEEAIISDRKILNL